MRTRKHSINSGGAEKDQRPIKWRGDRDRIPLVVRDTPHDPPPVLIDDQPVACAKINEKWLIHLLGALESLTQLDAWTSNELFAIGEIERLMNAMTSGSCEDDMPLMLRQNPTKKCLLEQSFDGGLSWSLAFDYSKCLRPADRITIQNTYNTAYNEYNDILNEYAIDNSVNTFAPALVFTGNPVVDDAKGIAICVACHAIVDACCNMVIEERQDTAGVAGVVAGVGGVVAGLIAIFGSAVFPPSVPLWIGIGTGLGGVAGSIFAGVSDEVLSNETARSLVACCMASVVKGQTPSLSIFSSSLGGCAFTGGSPEAQIAGAIAPLLSDPDIFALWLKYTNELVRQAELGLIECPCPEVYAGQLSNRGEVWGVTAPLGTYQLNISGTARNWSANPSYLGDAFYNTANGFSTVTPAPLIVNGSLYSPVPTYAPTHTYQVNIQNTTGSITLRYNDSPYSDNPQGYLSFTLERIGS